MNKLILIAAILFLYCSCKNKPSADLLVFNATIYTVDDSFSTVEAMAIKDGKLFELGKASELREKYDFKDEQDAAGKFIYPGFIDAHAHFVGYGNSLQRVDLRGTGSWAEAVEKTKQFAISQPDGWLEGRGWDQNDWVNKTFPDNKMLNEAFPKRPVLLKRVDGHAAIANQAALDLAGIKPGDKIDGGIVQVTNGELTGLLIDNAIDLVTVKIPAVSKDLLKSALMAAEKNCFAMGLTTIDDCGLSYKTVDYIKEFQDSGLLKMRLYVMLSDEPASYPYLEKKGIIKTERLHVRAFKIYGDGALGSRGACLLEPYSDQPGNRGFLLGSLSHFDSVASWISARQFQMCTHAIGDSGNRAILNIYAKWLGGKNDKRWRIEHAQVVNQKDFRLFGEYSVIPSVQPTHATSDMYWAVDRLGNDRVKGAYAYKQLMQENGWIPLGTDFPVEDISTFKTFYAAVARKDSKQWPEGGYQPENALTREEALRGMTIWAARSNFEENEKGSLVKGKFADFIILDKDLMKVSETDILSTTVLYTFLNGEKVYQKSN